MTRVKLVCAGVMLAASLVAGGVGYLFGFHQSRVLNADLLAVNARAFARILVASENEVIRRDAGIAFSSNVALIHAAVPDFRSLSASGASSLCVVAKHKAEVLQKMPKDGSEAFVKAYLEAMGSDLEKIVPFETELGTINPCLQPL